MKISSLYRALADDTRRKIIGLLLVHNYCVSELARVLKISESAVSQHLKVLKEADLLIGEKRSYYMHYDIDRDKLREMAREIDSMADLVREACTGPEGGETSCEYQQSGESCSAEVKYFCHGDPGINDKVKLPMTPIPGAKEPS
jgi:ArsR family transcriptional regulator